MKAKVKYKVIPNISPDLEGLSRLAYNLCFSWKDEIQDRFRRIDPRLWEECSHNPVLLLGLVSQERLNEFSRDHNFLAQLVNLVTPLYLGRVASFINQTKNMSSAQAEEVVEEQAQVFEDHKDYLIQIWDKKTK